MVTVYKNNLTVSLVSGETYRVPYWDVATECPGPRVLLLAGLHANELQGTEVLRRLLPILQNDLRHGSCLVVPFANPVAFERRQPHIDYELGRYYGDDWENNANGGWPGNPAGTNAQRLDHAIYSQLVSQATHCVDLHAWQSCLAATALVRTGYEPSLRLARASALRFARHAPWKPEVKQRPAFPCPVGAIFNDTGRAALCIELSGQNGYSEREIILGVRALKNCLRQLKMLSGALEGLDEPFIWLNEVKQVSVTAPASGMFIPQPWLPTDRVEEGELLGQIIGVQDLVQAKIHAPVAGYLFQFGPVRGVGEKDTVKDSRTNLHPYTTQGEVVAVIAAIP